MQCGLNEIVQDLQIIYMEYVVFIARYIKTDTTNVMLEIMSNEGQKWIITVKRKVHNCLRYFEAIEVDRNAFYEKDKYDIEGLVLDLEKRIVRLIKSIRDFIYLFLGPKQ